MRDEFWFVKICLQNFEMILDYRNEMVCTDCTERSVVLKHIVAIELTSD